MSSKTIYNELLKLRQEAPLIHNITNYVVMNNTANALLAIGASPVMAHAPQEVEEMVAIASALVINIGTLSDEWVQAMSLAMQAAAKKKIPIIFDPVGAGATTYRTHNCLQLLEQTAPAVIRANASEVLALAGMEIQTKGVDSVADGNSAEAAAISLAKKYNCVVVVSGATDLITDGQVKNTVDNGHPMMPKVTGLGCTASAIVAAFSAINSDMQTAATHAMAIMGICGELAAQKSLGPASLQTNFIDTLYTLDEEQILRTMK